jgi:uncharacterized protein YkwD
MKYTPCHLLVAAAGAMLCASCGPQLTKTTVPMSTSVSVAPSDGSLAGTVNAQVNSYRSARGESALPRHPGLDRLAQQHSEFMRQNRGKFGSSDLTHYGFEERALMAQRTMSMSNVGENIATCSRTGKDAAASVLVNAWKNSSSHDKNMRGHWDVTGVGVVVDSDGTVFATQLFASEDHTNMALKNRMRQF